MDAVNWVLFAYKVPPEPARHRVAAWRKLKSLGAVYIQSGVCVLPRTNENLRQLRTLEHDITETEGQAMLFEVVPLDAAQRARVIARFRSDRDEEYRELIDRCADFDTEITRETAAENFTYAELEENELDFKKLKAWYEKIAALDFYQAPLADDAMKHLAHCEARLEEFSQRVFEIDGAEDDGIKPKRR